MTGWKFKKDKNYWYKTRGDIEVRAELIPGEGYEIRSFYQNGIEIQRLGIYRVPLPTETKNIFQTAEQMVESALEYIYLSKAMSI